MQPDPGRFSPQLKRFSEFSDRAPRGLVVGLSLIALSLAVLVDWRPLGLRVVFPLYYLIPVCVLAWFAGWLPALAAALASPILGLSGLLLAGSNAGLPAGFLVGRVLTYGLVLLSARITATARHMLDFFVLGDQLRARIIPIRIGPRLVSIPTRDPDIRDHDFELKPDDIPLLIRPGTAFGSGSHETTQMCLMLIEDHLEPGQLVFDFGSGSGILSIAAAKLGARAVFAVDVAPQAEQVIRENIKLNQLEDIIQFKRGSWPVFLDASAVKPQESSRGPTTAGSEDDRLQADLLVANILTYVIVEALGEGLARCVRPGGKIILSGIRVDQWDEIRRALDETGLAIVERRQLKNWLAVLASKPAGPSVT